ncbi:MAG: hypothetical protein WCK65_13325 [Rhodospirillaceae bacterium]
MLVQLTDSSLAGEQADIGRARLLGKVGGRRLWIASAALTAPMAGLCLQGASPDGMILITSLRHHSSGTMVAAVGRS